MLSARRRSLWTGLFLGAGMLAVVLCQFSCRCPGCADRGPAGLGAAKEIIATDGAPKAIGPYSQAVMVGGRLYLSGQIAIDPASGELISGDISRETRQVLDNIGAVLSACGMSFADIVQVQVFLKNLDHYGVVNEIYAGYFTDNYPARAAVQVARLPKDVSIEIMAVAERGAGDRR